MLKRGLVLGLVLCFASVANAGFTPSFLELVPDAPGPYAQGDTVNVDILFHNLEGQDVAFRLAQVDFAASDPALTIADFGIDLSSLLSGFAYEPFTTDFASGVTVATVAMSAGSLPPSGFFLAVPDGGTLSLGAAVVTLPAVDGLYTLDVINTAAPDNNAGARFDYGFTSRTTLHTTNQNLGGGTVDLQVGAVPEPATLALLGIGGIAMLRRRRKA